MSRPGSSHTDLCDECHVDFQKAGAGEGWLLWIRSAETRKQNPCCKQGCNGKTTRQGIQLCQSCLDDYCNLSPDVNVPIWLATPKEKKRMPVINLPDMSNKAMMERQAAGQREQDRQERERIRGLPEEARQLRNEVWAQVRLLKEMGQHQNFCDRVMELFGMQAELAELREYFGNADTFEEFWASAPESSETSTDQLTVARMKHVSHMAFDRRKL